MFKKSFFLLFLHYISFVFSVLRVNEEVVNESEKNLGDEKPTGEEDAAEGNKENPVSESQEKEPEEKV